MIKSVKSFRINKLEADRIKIIAIKLGVSESFVIEELINFSNDLIYCIENQDNCKREFSRLFIDWHERLKRSDNNNDD